MPRLDAIGLIVSDMGRAIAFYKMLDLEFADDEVHAEAAGPGGLTGDARHRSQRPILLRLAAADRRRAAHCPRLSL